MTIFNIHAKINIKNGLLRALTFDLIKGDGAMIDVVHIAALFVAIIHLIVKLVKVKR